MGKKIIPLWLGTDPFVQTPSLPFALALIAAIARGGEFYDSDFIAPMGCDGGCGDLFRFNTDSVDLFDRWPPDGNSVSLGPSCNEPLCGDGGTNVRPR